MDPSSHTLLAELRGMQPLDMFGLGLIVVLIGLGLWRGLWWQVIRLLGLVLAVALARVFSPETAQWVSESWPSLEPRLTHGIAWVSIFMLTLGGASILGLLGQRILEAMQLGLANRVGGAIIGAATGIVIHLAILVVTYQLAPESFVTRHVAGTYSEQLVETAVGARWRVVLGAEATGEVQRVMELGDTRPPAPVPVPESPLESSPEPPGEPELGDSEPGPQVR